MVKLFVANLPPSATEQTLRDIFKDYPDLKDLSFSSTYGFVHFDTEESAIHAVNSLNGIEYRGFSIAVDFARGQPNLKTSTTNERNFRPPLRQPTMNPAKHNRFPQPSFQNFNTPLNNRFPSLMRAPMMHHVNNNQFRPPIEKQMYGGVIRKQYQASPDNYAKFNQSQYPFTRPNAYPDIDFSQNYPDDYEWNNQPQSNGNSGFEDVPTRMEPPYGVSSVSQAKRRRPDYYSPDFDYGTSDFFGNSDCGSQTSQTSQFPQRPFNPNWYDQPRFPERRPTYLSKEDHGKRSGGDGNIKSYIDEYDEEEVDYSQVDPYPAYLKQYRR